MKKTIQELNEQRAKCAQYVQMLGMQNTHGRSPQWEIESDARYRLAQDALDRADAEYREAIAALSTDELIALSQPEGTPR